MTRIYPCAECAAHFKEVVRCAPAGVQLASKAIVQVHQGT